MKSFLVRVTATIGYEEEYEDGENIITATEDGEEIGKITFQTETLEGDEDDPPYQFEPYQKEKFFKKICSYAEVLNIVALQVEPAHRGKGVAKELMTRTMAIIKKKYSGIPVYINASPMDDALSLDALVNFYKKFGFKVLKKYPEHRNALLWKDK